MMIKQGNRPISEKLGTRLGKITNASLSGVVTIPLLATLMARGVTYNNDFPAVAGIAFVALATLGTTVLYGKQAITWTEDSPNEPSND
jgi:hypothetical protein